MALSFAAIAAHPPISIPNIAQQDVQLVDSTVNALNKLQQRIDQIELDTLIVFSSHDTRTKNAISIHQADKLKLDFSTFGDLTEYKPIQNNLQLVHKLNHPSGMEGLKIVLDDRHNLDYGSSVVAYHLLVEKNLPAQLVVINIDHLPADKLIQYGQFVKEVVMNSELKIGVVATGDLAHTLSQKSPAGYWSEATKFDAQVLNYIKNEQLDKLATIEEQTVKQAVCCIWNPLMVLSGLLQDVNYEPHVLAYEHPVGIGYLTAELILS